MPANNFHAPFCQIPAKVPGGIYSDLLEAGILTSDLYYRFNEANYKWVAQTDWIYETSFSVTEEFLSKEGKQS